MRTEKAKTYRMEMGTELIGSTGMHTRIGNSAREIGYWINVEHVRHGYATEAVSALIKIGFTVENLKRIEIRCDPAKYYQSENPEGAWLLQYDHPDR